MVPPPTNPIRLNRTGRRETLCGKELSVVSPIRLRASTERKRSCVRGKPFTFMCELTGWSRPRINKNDRHKIMVEEKEDIVEFIG